MPRILRWAYALAALLTLASIGLLIAVILAGCATPGLTTTPTGTCDARMIEHNRRACAERQETLRITPSAPCGTCP